MTAHQWSTVPLDNQTADPRANWQEGQPASSLNNAARGMMASAALWRDDNLGILTATLGAGNVYSVTTGQGLIDPASTAGGGAPRISKPFSLKLAFDTALSGTSTNAPKLAIDGAVAIPLTDVLGGALADGDLVPLRSYELLGDTVVSGAVTRGRILGTLPSALAAAIAALAPSGFPIGGILPFTGGNTPTGFILANGPTLSRTGYSKLWAHAQASGLLTDEGTWLGNGGAYTGFYTTGDGSTTFRAPAINGSFLRALDYGRGLDPGRAMGTLQADAFRSHNHPLQHGGVVISGYAGYFPANVDTGPYLQIDNIGYAGGPETRPVNVAYPFLLKAY